MKTQQELKEAFVTASDALRAFPLLPNGLISDKVRKSRKFKLALKTYSQAKAELNAYYALNKTQGK